MECIKMKTKIRKCYCSTYFIIPNLKLVKETVFSRQTKDTI